MQVFTRAHCEGLKKFLHHDVALKQISEGALTPITAMKDEEVENCEHQHAPIIPILHRTTKFIVIGGFNSSRPVLPMRRAG